MNTNQTSLEIQPSPIVEVTDIDQMVRILIEWNKQKVAILQHMIELPDATQVDIEEDNPIVLTGDVKRAFQLGIQLSIEELGNLPFTIDNNENAH